MHSLWVLPLAGKKKFLSFCLADSNQGLSPEGPVRPRAERSSVVLSLEREGLAENFAGPVISPLLPRSWPRRISREERKTKPDDRKPPASEILDGSVNTDSADSCTSIAPVAPSDPAEIDPLYLFACHIEWEKREDPGAGWELIIAAQSWHDDTRAHARALLGGSRHIAGASITSAPSHPKKRASLETEMNTPYDLEIVENCTECSNGNPSFFCALPYAALHTLDEISHKSTLPAGAILFVEGQAPRGLFILCSGRVNLSTTSREGKTLILKTAYAGEALGLSAALSGTGYEMTAATATPCQVNFIDRKHFLELLESHSETGLHAAQALSRDYRSAYRDIHELVLTRSSAGKLARLLLAQSEAHDGEGKVRVPAGMTHEEMAQRIGASRETVTRLLSRLRKKKLIRLDGPNVIIHDRPGLEALTI